MADSKPPVTPDKPAPGGYQDNTPPSLNDIDTAVDQMSSTEASNYDAIMKKTGDSRGALYHATNPVGRLQKGRRDPWGN